MSGLLILSQLATRGHVRCHVNMFGSTPNVLNLNWQREDMCVATSSLMSIHPANQSISIGNERTCALPPPIKSPESSSMKSQLATRGHVRCHVRTGKNRIITVDDIRKSQLATRGHVRCHYRIKIIMYEFYANLLMVMAPHR